MYTPPCTRSLALDEASISALHLDSVDQPWVDAMLKFRLLALNSAGMHGNMYVCVAQRKEKTNHTRHKDLEK